MVVVLYITSQSGLPGYFHSSTTCSPLKASLASEWCSGWVPRSESGGRERWRKEGTVVFGGGETATTRQRIEKYKEETSSHTQPVSVALTVTGKQEPGPGV